MVAAAAGLTARLRGDGHFRASSTGLIRSSCHLLVIDPAAYAVVVAGVGGFYLFTVALQAGSVNAAAAALVVGETVIPGAVGLTLLAIRSAQGGRRWRCSPSSRPWPVRPPSRWARSANSGGAITAPSPWLDQIGVVGPRRRDERAGGP